MAFDDPKTLEDVAARLLEAARVAGADAADASVVAEEALSVSARGGALEEVERAETLDFSLRVFRGPRSASISASDAAPATVAALAERAVAMADAAPADPYEGLADPAQLAQDRPDLDQFDPTAFTSAERLLDDARALEAAACAVTGVSQAENATAGWSRRTRLMVATNGLAHQVAATSLGRSVSAVARADGAMERDYAFSSARHGDDLRGAEAIGHEAGERAVKRLSPRKGPTGRATVVFDPRVAARLVGALLSAVNGQAVARGASFLAGKIGESVAAPTLTLLDDPRRPRGLGSRAVDAEGLPTAPRTLIDAGVLQGWLLDLPSARRLGLESTGSSGGGAPSASNAWIAPGSASAEALIGEIASGFYVTELMGRGANPITGDFSSGAAGFWIENGALAYPVAEMTIAGAMPEMLAACVPANDVIFDKRIVAPTLRIEGMTVAGG